MTKIAWREPGSRKYEGGLDRGVLYPLVGSGVPWDGLLAVTEAPVGGDVESFWYDGVKYRDVSASEDFFATLEAYIYPLAFELCDGTASPAVGMSVMHQPRQPFGLCYRNLIGDDLKDFDAGYKTHLIYNATASPSERARKSFAQEKETSNFSWALNAVPVPITGCKPSAHISFDSTLVDPEFLEFLELILYGDDTTDARLPSPSEILEMIPGFYDPEIIIPHEVTGLADLVPGMGDLVPLGIEGLFLRPSNSRLSETTTPGIYELEE